MIELVFLALQRLRVSFEITHNVLRKPIRDHITVEPVSISFQEDLTFFHGFCIAVCLGLVPFKDDITHGGTGKRPASRDV